MEKIINPVDYIDKNSNYREELILLRDILTDTEMTECMKWSIPCYTINDKNVIGLAAFKAYVGLWFYQGVFLKDAQNVLINANEEKTRAMRQWRFTNTNEIDVELVRSYILEAIENQKAGKEIKAVKAKKVETPILLEHALESDSELEKAYHNLTPGKQREYAEYIGAAKQEKTRISRLEKSYEMILLGKGLNDKYS